MTDNMERVVQEVKDKNVIHEPILDDAGMAILMEKDDLEVEIETWS